MISSVSNRQRNYSHNIGGLTYFGTDKTTDENLTGENWELILNLCDKVIDEGEQGCVLHSSFFSAILKSRAITVLEMLLLRCLNVWPIAIPMSNSMPSHWQNLYPRTVVLNLTGRLLHGHSHRAWRKSLQIGYVPSRLSTSETDWFTCILLDYA